MNVKIFDATRGLIILPSLETFGGGFEFRLIITSISFLKNPESVCMCEGVQRGGGENTTPSIHCCEKRRSQKPWRFYHKTVERLCVVETIAFLPFFPSLFQMCCSSRIAHVATDSPFRKKKKSRRRLPLPFFFFKKEEIMEDFLAGLL